MDNVLHCAKTIKSVKKTRVLSTRIECLYRYISHTFDISTEGLT